MKVAISSGHGAINPDSGWVDPGACNGKYTEHNIAKALVEEVCHLIDGKIKYYVPKPNWNTQIEYSDAIKNGCDYYINIHLNSSTNTSARYVEGYYYNDKSLAWTREIVMALSDFFPNNGVKYDYGVSGQKNATIPYAFIECGFISNPKDLGIHLGKRRDLAIAIVSVLEKFSGVKVSKEIRLSTTGPNKDYAVVDGKKILMPLHLIQIKGRNMIDLRFIIEQLGGTIEWLPETKEIIIQK
ncbi:MAG: N-acetylmuramoyl-L-alanine amidase [Methanogenium sp.]|jgi:N-acetylmuramoyl-L-alanine amidase